MTERRKTNGVVWCGMEWNEGDGPAGMLQCSLLYHHSVPVPPTLKMGNQMDYTFNHYAHTTLICTHPFIHSFVHSSIRIVQAEARLKTNTNFSFRKKHTFYREV